MRAELEAASAQKEELRVEVVELRERVCKEATRSEDLKRREAMLTTIQTRYDELETTLLVGPHIAPSLRDTDSTTQHSRSLRPVGGPCVLCNCVHESTGFLNLDTLRTDKC